MRHIVVYSKHLGWTIRLTVETLAEAQEWVKWYETKGLEAHWIGF